MVMCEKCDAEAAYIIHNLPFLLVVQREDDLVVPINLVPVQIFR